MSDTNPAPSHFCDMVMKGGITSGIVYPLAAAKLAERFVFKNIGGTSAGAIAAAAAAAAELTRTKGGFERLRALPQFLGAESPDKSGSNLLAFFQPQPKTAGLFRICIAALGGGLKGFVSACLRTMIEFWAVTLFVALLSGCFIGLTFSNASGAFRIFCFVVGGTVFLTTLILGLVMALTYKVTHAIPSNFYGLCSGMTDDFSNLTTDPPTALGKPLTFWLVEYLNSFLGRKAWDPPLIFSELWGTTDPDAERLVNLEMMTTCLTHGRPYRLPFRDDIEIHENQFYFRSDDFGRLFPKSVVKWMIDHPRTITAPAGPATTERIERREELKRAGYYSMPDPGNLPVAVAVRMSLSFPILLSAVPLYAIDRSRDPKGLKPERCWFTDGGVCSNFPIHFFDSPLPRRPTLSIDLIEKPPGTPAAAFLEPQMVTSNRAGIQESWNRFERTEKIDPSDSKAVLSQEKPGLYKLTGFFGAFITTMQNWSDNTLSRLPGYRDRIRPVPLSPDEGGLNLNMPKERIETLTARGGAAADELIGRFWAPYTEPEMNWDNHRWLRMRTSLSSIETLLSRIDRACANPEQGDLDFESWIAQPAPWAPPSYPWTQPKRDLALAMIHEFRQLIAATRTANTLIGDGSPRPKGELRQRAQV